MPEKLVLTVAEQIAAPTTEYSVSHISLNNGWDLGPSGVAVKNIASASVNVIMIGQNNTFRSIMLANGQAAIDMIKALNKANLTIKSLEKRVLEAVIAFDAKYAGNISGAPD